VAELPRVVLTAVIEAPGRAAPEESFTVPESEAWPLCAQPGDEQSANRRAAPAAQEMILLILIKTEPACIT
jgi:hypothetical protein